MSDCRSYLTPHIPKSLSNLPSFPCGARQRGVRPRRVAPDVRQEWNGAKLRRMLDSRAGSGYNLHEPRDLLPAENRPMPVDTVVDLVVLLRQHRLIEPAQLDELARTIAPRFHDPRSLAKELLQ